MAKRQDSERGSLTSEEDDEEVEDQLHSQQRQQNGAAQQQQHQQVQQRPSMAPPPTPGPIYSLDPSLSSVPLAYETTNANSYEMQRLGKVRGSIRISMEDVNDHGDLDQLEIHQQFQIMPKSSGSSRSGAFVKIANIQGNHVFSCSIKRRTRFLGFMGKGAAKTTNKDGSRIKTKEDHAYRLLDTQGFELITGKLVGRSMEARTPFKNTLGIVTKKAWNNTFVIEPTVGDEFWTCVPSSGCCLCSCGIKRFRILDSASKQIGSMLRDQATDKFIISMPDELTVQNKGLILLTGLMIFDMFFSETSCCNGVFNARLCCCTTCCIITILIIIIVLVLVLTLVVLKDDDPQSAELEATTTEIMGMLAAS